MTICSRGGGQFSDLSKFKTIPIKGRAGINSSLGINLLLDPQCTQHDVENSSLTASSGHLTGLSCVMARDVWGEQEGWSQATHFKIQPGVVALLLCLTPLVTPALEPRQGPVPGSR